MRRSESKNKINNCNDTNKQSFKLRNFFKNGLYLNSLKKCADNSCQTYMPKIKTPIYMGYDMVFCSKVCRSKILENFRGELADLSVIYTHYGINQSISESAYFLT